MPEDILALPPPPADLRIAYGADPFQFGDLRLPSGPGPHPVICNVHGGFWRSKYDLAHAGHLCAAFTNHGFATWNLEYRRVGNPGGGWPGSLDDLQEAIHFLPRLAALYNLNLDSAQVWGHSAGGQLALCLAAREPGLQAAVSLAGVLDLVAAYDWHLGDDAVVQFLGGPPDRLPCRFQEADPGRCQIAPKQWILHGLEDDVVPHEISRNYIKRKENRGERIDFLELPACDHFDLIDPRSAVFPEVLRVLTSSENGGFVR
jgi:acetyl esterase/lipase